MMMTVRRWNATICFSTCIFLKLSFYCYEMFINHFALSTFYTHTHKHTHTNHFIRNLQQLKCRVLSPCWMLLLFFFNEIDVFSSLTHMSQRSALPLQPTIVWTQFTVVVLTRFLYRLRLKENVSKLTRRRFPLC